MCDPPHSVLDWVVLIIFIAEIVVKLLAEGSKPWCVNTPSLYTALLLLPDLTIEPFPAQHDTRRTTCRRFFLDGWNCFDFAIVTAGLMPISGGEAVTALRLVRLLRVLKLVRSGNAQQASKQQPLTL